MIVFNILACNDDEECLRIKECEEYKYVLARDYGKLKKMVVCGVKAKTVKESITSKHSTKLKYTNCCRMSIAVK